MIEKKGRVNKSTETNLNATPSCGRACVFECSQIDFSRSLVELAGPFTGKWRMGSNWSTHTRAEGLPRRRETKNKNNCAGRPSFAGDVPSFPTVSVGSAFPKFIHPEYPKFNPTLFFVDITTKDVACSRKMERRRRVAPPRSKIYLYSPNDGHFMMTFTATNPEFVFVHVKDRPATEEQNTRSTQARSNTKIVKSKHPSYVFPLHAKTYASDDTCSGDTAVSNNTNNNTTKPTVSTSGSERFDGKITITKDDMKFILPIKGEIGIGKQFRHSNSNNEIGNCCASLLVKVDSDGDICRINFDIDDIEFATVLLKTSRGCQASDQRMYYKTKGTIKPVIYVALPISTYVYQDPMVQIKSKNRRQHLNGFEPAWMAETRRERVQHLHRVEEKPEYQGVMPSSFVVERGGYVLRAKTGILRAKVADGIALYDEFVRAHSSDLSKYNHDNVYDVFELPSIAAT